MTTCHVVSAVSCRECRVPFRVTLQVSFPCASAQNATGNVLHLREVKGDHLGAKGNAFHLLEVRGDYLGAKGNVFHLLEVRGDNLGAKGTMCDLSAVRGD